MQSAQLASSATGKGAARCDGSGTNLENQFEKASNVFLDAIVNGKSDSILGLWSKDGVTQGIDGPTVSGREIRNHFGKRSGLFCLMFDTGCLRKIHGFGRDNSYRDLFSKAAGKKVKCHVDRSQSMLIGELRVDLQGGLMNELKGVIMLPLEFDFVYENGNWKLATLP